MVATFVVRVIAEQLRQGEFVGEAEHVASGRTTAIRDAEDLERFVRDVADEPPRRRPPLGGFGALLLVAVALLAALPSSASALACDTSWTGGGGDWHDASKWTAGVPDATKNACVTADGTYTVTAMASTVAKAVEIGGATGTQTVTVSSAPSSHAAFNVGTGASVINPNGELVLTGGGMTEITGDNAANPLANHGTIRTTGASVDARPNAAITNAADGTVAFDAGGCICNGGRAFRNEGTVTVAAGEVLSVLNLGGAGPTVEQAGGTWTNTGSTWVRGGTYRHLGGTVTGNPTESCDARLDPGGTGTGTYLVHRMAGAGCSNGGQLIGPVGAGITVRLRNEAEVNTLDVGMPAGGLTVHGTLTMEGGAGGGGGDDYRVLTVGEHVTVAAGGTLRVLGLGNRVVQGGITNNGTVELHRFVNLDNSPYTQGPGGTLRVRVAGTDPGADLGRVLTNGDVTLDGTLAVETTITPAGTVRIIDNPAGGTRTGTFATTTFTGPAWTVEYPGNDVELTASATPTPTPSPTPTVTPSPTATPATTFDLKGTWTLDTGAATSTETYTQMDKATGAFSGSGGANGYSWPTTGAVSGSQVTFKTGPYVQLPSYSATFTGTISADGNTISGTWKDTLNQTGRFSMTRGAGPVDDAHYLGNWELDALDPSGTYRYSLSNVTISSAEGPATKRTFRGRGSNPLRTFAVTMEVSGAKVRMTLSEFSGLGGYTSSYEGVRGADGSISGTWSDGSTNGRWTMTRGTRPAATAPPKPATSLHPRTPTTGGVPTVQVTTPTSCNLTATSAGVFAGQRLATLAKKGKRRRLKGVKIARFGPVFVPAGQKVVIPVQPSPLIKKKRRAKGKKASAAATTAATARMTASCDPVAGPTSSAPPPAAPSAPVKTTVDVPVKVPVSNQPENRWPKKGIWVGTPIGSQAGGIVFDVSGDGKVIDKTPPAGGPIGKLTVSAQQQCGASGGLTLSGTGGFTLTKPIAISPSGTRYPKVANFQGAPRIGGVPGSIRLYLTFSSDTQGSATIVGYPPVVPPQFGCFVASQSFSLQGRPGNSAPSPPSPSSTYPTGE